MQLTRPLHDPLGDLFTEFDRLFRTPVRGAANRVSHAVPRGFSLYESDDDWRLRADLPGFAKEDLGITLSDGVLHLTARRADHGNGLTPDFSQDLRLPEALATDRISAHLENGVLELVLPKQEPPKPETIQIQVN